MTFIDTNLTYSKQVCDYAVGSIMGTIGLLYLLGKLFLILLGFYAVYRITQIFILKYSYPRIKQIEKQLKKLGDKKK